MHQPIIRIKQLPLILFLVLILSSCASIQKIAYFQNEPVDKELKMNKGPIIKVEPQDQLSIVVSSKDPLLASLFNLARVQQTVGQSSETGTNNKSGEIMGYTVDSKGNIDFPILGEIHIEGLSREEIAKTIKDQLTNKNLIKDPIITVDFQNLYFSVLGEVSKPGQFNIDKDKTTLIEALSKAGDLTIYGERGKVYLTRQNNGTRITYQVDLRSSDIYNSPAFYIKQNDVIYVQPNNVKANQSTVNGNNVKSVSLWISVTSLLTTVGVLIFK